MDTKITCSKCLNQVPLSNTHLLVNGEKVCDQCYELIRSFFDKKNDQ